MPEDELLEALRGLGADHEPDVAAIRRRMEGERPNVVPLRRRIEQGPRRRPVFLSAAAALLIGGGVTVAASQMGPADTGTPANELPVSVPGIATPSDSKTSAEPDPTESDSDTGNTRESTPDGADASKDGQSDSEDKQSDAKDDSAPTRTTESKQPPSSGQAVSGSAAASSVTPLTAGQEIFLSGADEDWLAIGSRNDMKTVRKKDSSASPLLNFLAPESATSVDGPFRFSWDGGIPEENRTGSTRWMQTNGAVVTVTASQAARTVTLYTGNAMNIVVKGGGLKDHRVTLGDNAPGFVTTVQIPSHSGDTTIELQSGRGPVHLAAATAASR